MLLYLIKEMGRGARPHLNGAKVRHKFLFIPATSSEFFAADLVALANADRRNFYKVEKWTRDGQEVDHLLFAGNNLRLAQQIFANRIPTAGLQEQAEYSVACLPEHLLALSCSARIPRRSLSILNSLGLGNRRETPTRTADKTQLLTLKTTGILLMAEGECSP
jgi:hypothetical protein